MRFRNNNHILSTILCFTFASSFGIASSVSAQDQSNCAGLDWRELRRCIWLTYERADRELNLVWQQVISQLSGDEKEQLIDQELAWIEERDITCRGEASMYRGGTIYPTVFNDCRTRVTRERTEFLRGYLR